MKPNLRAAIYIRISDARDGETVGVDRQLEDCQKLCINLGFEVSDIYNDNNKSAMSGKRPQYQRLLLDIAAGSIDVIVTYSAERLYRQNKELEGLIDDIGQIMVHTVQSGHINLETADGKMVARILGATSQHESEKKGERIARAALQRAEMGRFGGGKRRFGYSEGCKELITAEASAIVWGTDYIRNGGTLEAVKREWHQRGLVGPLGAKFDAVTVRGVLLRPMNGGVSQYKGEFVGKTQFPSIVSEEDYLECRSILKDPSRRTTVGRPVLSMLAGVIRCGICGGRVSTRKRRGTYNGKYIVTAIYCCREAHASRTKSLFDEAISQVVLGILKKNSKSLMAPISTAPAKVSAMSAEMSKLSERRNALALIVASGDLSPADFARAVREIESRQNALEPIIAASVGKRASSKLASSEDIEKTWAGYSDAKRRLVIVELIDKIIIGKGKPRIFSMENVEIVQRNSA
jgi:DNA invertase Pin-like site-specific DNA recombinase